MPLQPTTSSLHVNRPLSNISVHFAQSQTGFVADRAFRFVPSANQGNRYITYDRGEFNRDEMQKRAPSTESSGSGYTIDNSPTYFCDVWAHHKDVDDQLVSNADAPIDLNREAVEFVTTKMMLKKEITWRDTFFVPSVWTTDFTPGTLWDAASSVPISDVRTGIRTVLESTGLKPNVMVMGRYVFDALMDNSDIIDRLNRGQTPVGPAMANEAQLAALFGVEEILVMDAIQNTAAKGATNVHSFIGGKHALLAYRPPRAGVLTPAAGYTFVWTGFTGATANGARIKRFREERIESWRVEIQGAWDQKLVAPDLGYFFEDVVS